MSDIIKYMQYQISINGDYVIYVFTFAIFVIFSTVIFVFTRVAQRNREVKKRAYASSMAGSGASIFDPLLPRNTGVSAVSNVFYKTATRFESERKSKSSSAIREDLIHAGFHDPSALSWYYFSRLLSSAALPAIGFPILLSTQFAESTLIIIVILILLTLIGMIIPSLYLMRRKSQMNREFRDGFPEFMDLLVVCSEAGLGLQAAIDRVTKEIAKTHKNLGVNLHIMVLEMRAGAKLTEAFESLAHRVTIDEVRSLGSLLQQSEELGTSLSEALRVYSLEMREKRFFRAEEKAYSLPAKMTIPLGCFVFPAMLIIIMLPLLIRMQFVATTMAQ